MISVALSAVVAVISAGGGTAPNPVQTENSRAGTDPGTWVQPAVAPRSIEGYASELSVLPGEEVHFHVSTADGNRYRIELYRLGWYGGLGARLIACLPACGGDEPGRDFGNPVNLGGGSAGWPVTDTFAVPADAPSGYYYALLRLTRAGDDTGARGFVVFIVSEQPSHHSQILVQVPVNTWQAYNPWGGKSLYLFNSTDGVAATHVSFERPLIFTAQGPFDAEYNLVRFLERNGYDVSYQTDVDTHRHPESLLAHRLIVVAGHDEYWTKQMRDAFEAARDSGTNLAFTGSNAAYWQIRYEDGERTIVSYKNAASDPEPDPALKTILFRELTPPRHECALMGVMHLRLRPHQSGPVDYTVTSDALTDPWFTGTTLQPGDQIHDVVGNEWDSLPDAPPPPACVKPGLRVLFHYEGSPANADAVRYTAPSGARVFAGGAQNLPWGLDGFNLRRFGHTEPADSRFELFMRNALDDLTRPAAPTAVQVRVRRRTLKLHVRAFADPRVVYFEIYRHRGPQPFALTDAEVVHVCRTTSICMQRRLRFGVYRFAAVAVDEWGSSYATLSRPVLVRKLDR